MSPPVTSPKSKAAKDWLPLALVEDLATLDFGAFVARYTSPYYLAIILGDRESDVRFGLDEATNADGLAYRTLPSEGLLATGLGPPPAPRREQDVIRLLQDLMNGSAYVVALQKRSNAFLHFISVGRTRNHDVVLRDPSVSKFHATFALEGEKLVVKDAGSRNHTYVNDRKLAEPSELVAGDRVRFGAVNGVICSPSSLWLAAHADGV